MQPSFRHLCRANKFAPVESAKSAYADYTNLTRVRILSFLNKRKELPEAKPERTSRRRPTSRFWQARIYSPVRSFGQVVRLHMVRYLSSNLLDKYDWALAKT